jgi:hypothetical protein
MGAGEQILERLAALEVKVDRLLNHIGANKPTGAVTGGAATLAQTQATGGDPEIKWDIKSWKGPSFKGLLASECSAEFLDAYADYHDWKADNPKDGREKFAPYDRRTAALCRRWSIEIREGRHEPKPRTKAAPPRPPPRDDDESPEPAAEPSPAAPRRRPPPPPTFDD